MESKLFFSLFLLVSSWVFVGVSSLDFDIAGAGAGASAAAGEAPACLQKLLACQPYLVAAPPSPPASCCVPLKEIIDNDIQCLCQVFDNPMIMNTLNLTKDEALKLSKTCGVNIDASVCKTAATPPGASETTPSGPTAPISNSSSSASSKSNAANGISYFGGSSFIAFFVAFIVSVF